MGSIRSLATITILGVVAAFLYVKINEAPMGAHSQQGEATPGVPPLGDLSAPGGMPSAAPGNYDATSTSAAPPWSAAAPPTAPEIGPSANATAPTSAAELPPVPTIPAMPDLPDSSADAAAVSPMVPAAAAPAGLPASIPTAQYGGSSLTPPDGISGRVPSLGTTTPNLAASQPTPPAPALSMTPPAMPAPPELSPNNSSVESGLVAVDAALTAPAAAPPAIPMAPAAATTPALPAVMPAAPSAPPASNQAINDDNRYGEDNQSSATTQAASAKVGVSSFDAGWPVIQAALERGELARAHLLLSQWYEDPSLTPAESQQVETLLGQLAGSVVYSNEHQLEPAYVVQPGETLETIAQKYNVPWQLLAKINGIPAANQVQPGQQLKVVRGPFSAVIELGRSQLTVMLDGRYAGKFPIDVTPGASLPEGQWVVQDKPAAPMPQTSPYAAALPSVARSLQLRNASATDANPGVPLTIGSAPASGLGGMSPLGSTQATPYLVKVAPADANELVDILSIGSRVVIQR
jgi:LysM repeat protein